MACESGNPLCVGIYESYKLAEQRLVHIPPARSQKVAAPNQTIAVYPHREGLQITWLVGRPNSPLLATSPEISHFA